MRALAVLVAVTWLIVPVARADERAQRARVLAYAERRWGQCSRDAVDGTGLDTDVEIELVVLGRDHALALVRTACHRALDGAYNFVSSVVEIRGRRVTLVRVDSEEQVWNAELHRAPQGIHLFTGARMRAIGDSGSQALHRWNGSRFVRVLSRLREGGSHAPDDVGEYPILSPPERACFAQLEVTASRTARLRATHGRTEHELVFELDDTECTGVSRDTLGCAGGVEYGIVSRDTDWVVLRLTGSEEREVARAPMRCTLW